MLKQSLLCLGLAACVTLPTWAETSTWGRWSTIRFPGKVVEMQPYGFYVDTPSHLHIYVRQDQRVMRNGQTINPTFLQVGNAVQIVVPAGKGQIRLRDDDVAVLSTPDGLAQVPEDNLELAMEQSRLSALTSSSSNQYYLSSAPVRYPTAAPVPSNPVYSSPASYYLSSYDPPMAPSAYSYPPDYYQPYSYDYSYPAGYANYPVGYNNYTNPNGSFNWESAAVTLAGTAIAAGLSNNNPYSPYAAPYYGNNNYYTNTNGSFNWGNAAVTLAGTAIAASLSNNNPYGYNLNSPYAYNPYASPYYNNYYYTNPNSGLSWQNTGFMNNNYAYNPYSGGYNSYVNYNPTYVNYSNPGWNRPQGNKWNRGHFRNYGFQPAPWNRPISKWNRAVYQNQGKVWKGGNGRGNQPRFGNWNRANYKPRVNNWNRGNGRNQQPRVTQWNRGYYQPRVSNWNRGNRNNNFRPNRQPRIQQPRFQGGGRQHFNSGGFRNFNPGGGGGGRHFQNGGGRNRNFNPGGGGGGRHFQGGGGGNRNFNPGGGGGRHFQGGGGGRHSGGGGGRGRGRR